jgi:D-cysteine desulfhydrase family pyridoxal phosphate-dependent enzyme
MKLDEMARLRFGHLPTPLDEAPRLGELIGLKRLLIKRDDLTGLGLGGNKVRKLEFLMADAQAQNADIVLTDGGPQSNHARLTAAAARVVGMDARLILGGPKFDRFDGNLLLDILFGAEIRYMVDANVKHMEAEMAREAEELRSEGRRPYIIPIGGSSPVGALGYVEGMRELAEQLADDKAPHILFAVGSAGTLAGVLAGTKLFLPEAKVTGISVGRKKKPLQKVAKQVGEAALALLGETHEFDLEAIDINHDYVGKAYGVTSEAGNEAVFAAARTEAIILDPVYTGKAMAGLMDLAKRGAIDRDRTTIFIHTGGSPALFAFEEEFREHARYSEVSKDTSRPPT